MNSTGICVQKYDGENKVYEDFIILKPVDKDKPETKWLNKKEKNAEDNLTNFRYCFYPKVDISIYKDNNHFSEYWKSKNISVCAKTIKDIVKEWTKDNPEQICIVMEGISYGSSNRTKSIFDLAGLNYLIRDKFIERPDIIFTIATPSNIKKFASGNGNCNKDIIVNLFKQTHTKFDIVPKIDDISDAWFMSNYAKQLYESIDNE